MRTVPVKTGIAAPPRHIRLGVGVLGVALAGAVGVWPPGAGGPGERLGLAVWVLIATWIAVVDTSEHRIPNRLVAALSVYTLGALTAASLVDGEWGAAVWLVVWAMVTVTVGLAVHVVSAGGLGMGDVKLAFPVALLLGRYGSVAVWTGLLVTPLAAGVFLGYRHVLRLPQEPVPLAPFLLAGVASGLLVV